MCHNLRPWYIHCLFHIAKSRSLLISPLRQHDASRRKLKRDSKKGGRRTQDTGQSRAACFYDVYCTPTSSGARQFPPKYSPCTAPSAKLWLPLSVSVQVVACCTYCVSSNTPPASDRKKEDRPVASIAIASSYVTNGSSRVEKGCSRLGSSTNIA